MALVGVEREPLVSEPDALTTRPLAISVAQVRRGTVTEPWENFNDVLMLVESGDLALVHTKRL